MVMQKTERRLLLDTLLLAVSFLSIVGCQLLPVDVGFLILVLGCTLAFLVAVDLLIFLKKQSSFPKLKTDVSGMAWIWVVAGLAIVFTPFIYWAVGWPFDIVTTQMLSLYTLSGTMASAFTAVRLIISYLLAFCVFFIVIWSIVNAKSSAYGGQ
jgi:hypothetical protein